MGNLIGMIPYNFTFTSHIIVTFGLAMIAFGMATLVGFIRHGFHYFSLFVPKGAPVYMLPLIILMGQDDKIPWKKTLGCPLYSVLKQGLINFQRSVLSL